jgi:hypothetical protein
MFQPNEGQYRNIPLAQLVKYLNVTQNSHSKEQMIGMKIGTAY